MYALKLLTVTPDGRQVEESHALGDMYRLEMYPQGVSKNIVAYVEHAGRDGSTPAFTICRSDSAYITLLNGDTVRHVCRGDAEERFKIAQDRGSKTGEAHCN